MKKIVSLLSVLTISATAAPATIAASPYQKEEVKLENIEINYSQTNNLEIKRLKREHYNKNEIYIWYRFLAYNGIQIRISNDTFNEISFKHDIKSKKEFENYLYLLLKEFPFYNGSVNAGDGYWYISNEDIWHCVYVISKHYDEILSKFNSKKDNNRGIKIITNRSEDWSDYSNSYGVFLDN